MKVYKIFMPQSFFWKKGGIIFCICRSVEQAMFAQFLFLHFSLKGAKLSAVDAPRK